ncbi:MAG: hypothetical protein HQM09_22725, partial [Candidatus Riflebacteria bacterium]|nr:hypothetical protein [Candidatus Riflebacteria bacterium]
FSLCLMGSLIWCHRPGEATARGSIPVLGAEHARFQSPRFADLVNAVIVDDERSPAGWGKALDRILHFEPAEIERMRIGALEICSADLRWERIMERYLDLIEAD